MTRRKECTITVAWDESGKTIAITRKNLEARIEATFAPDRRATVIVGQISDITPDPVRQVEQLLAMTHAPWQETHFKIIELVRELAAKCN
jgi:hypothetical protein